MTSWRINPAFLVGIWLMILHPSFQALHGISFPDTKTEVVRLLVTVVDKEGKPIQGLSYKDFTIREDGVVQQIGFFSSTESPVSLGVVLDTSGSMRTKLPAAQLAAQELFGTMTERDEAFVMQFKSSDSFIVRQDFTRDQGKLKDALTDLKTGGGTSMLDAISAGANYLHRERPLTHKVLVLITDGLEKNSSLRQSKVEEVLKKTGVRIFFIAIMEQGDSDSTSLFRKSPDETAKELMKRLTEDAGGRVYLPKTAGDLKDAVANISSVVHSAYAIAWYSTNYRRDGKFRRVEIEVRDKDKRKLNVMAPRGYYAPASQP